MKHITAIILCIFLPLSLYAKAPTEDHKGITLGFSFGIGQPHKEKRPSSSCHHVGMFFMPNIGFRITKAWEIGAFARYEDQVNVSSWWGFGGYVEYSFLFRDSDRFRMFIDLRASDNKDQNTWIGGPAHYNFTEIGFVPGIAYRIPHSRFDLKLRYLFIGYNNIIEKRYKDIPGCLGRHGNWILDAGLRRLEIGASVTF